MKAERFETHEHAKIEVLGKNSAVHARIQNLSKTGACVDWAPASFQLMKGDLIRMKVELLGLKKEHLLNGEVIWTDGKRSGIQFLNSDELFDKMIVR